MSVSDKPVVGVAESSTARNLWEKTLTHLRDEGQAYVVSQLMQLVPLTYVDNVLTLVDSPAACATIETNLKANSPNGLGAQGCVVTFQLTGELR